MLAEQNRPCLGIGNQGLICGYIREDGVIWSESSTQVLDRSATFRVGRKRTAIDSADATAINAAGKVVGTALGGLSRRAAFWPNPNENIVLLDSFLKRSSFEKLNGASDINGDGEIVGYGTDADGFSAGFLAIPN